MRILLSFLFCTSWMTAHADCGQKLIVGSFDSLLEEKAKHAAKIAAAAGAPLELGVDVTHALALPDGGAAFAIVVTPVEGAPGEVFLVNVTAGGETLAVRQTAHDAAVEAVVQAHIAGDYRLPGLWLGSSPRVHGGHAVSVLTSDPKSGFVVMEFITDSVQLTPAEYRMTFVVVDGRVVAEGEAIKREVRK